MSSPFCGANDSELAHEEALKETGFWGRSGAGAIIVARSSGRILLGLRSDEVLEPFTWGGWGGAIDIDEIPILAAEREFREETGYHDVIADIVTLPMFRSEDFRYYNHLIVIDHEFTPVLNWEHVDHCWCQFDNLPDPLHFGMTYLYSQQGVDKTIARFGPPNSPTLSSR